MFTLFFCSIYLLKMSKSIRIALQKEQELTSQFMDMFAKFIIHNADTISGLHYDIRSCMKYSELSECLSNMSRMKHNGLKSPNMKQSANQTISFNFQSKSNTIVFMLDLSPYMLIYNYGSKTFPLKNMQEIIINLLRKLAERHQSNKEYVYNVTIYLFSTHKKYIEAILLNQSVNDWNVEQLCQFVSLTIEKSKLPHLVDPQRASVSQLLQLVFNGEELSQGIKSLIVVSSFNQEPVAPIMLFTPNWYTFSFINTGGHFGSYKVENKSLYQKLIPGVCFKTKFVFKSRFLENWEMTDRVKRENPALTKPVTEKFRSIQFQLDQEVIPDIFDLILVFKVEFKHELSSKIRSGGESVISSIKDSNRIILKTYNIPAESFFYVLRTRYIQGWQPVLTANSMAIENSKFKLRLPIEQDEMLFYEASRIKNNFKIVIYELLKMSKDSSGYDKSEQLNMIQKMDKLISYNFITIVNENLKISTPQPIRQNPLNCHLFQQHSQKEIVSYIYNIKEWGKFFKLKRLCFKFQPEYNPQALEEVTGQISFILGKRLINSIFIKQNEVQSKGSDKIEDVEVTERKVMLTKINVSGNILELEMAFLRFTFIDIKTTLYCISQKLEGRTFKKGVEVIPVPIHVCQFHKSQDIANHHMFHKKWTLKFKSNSYLKLFLLYFQSVLRKLNYDEIHLKTSEDNIRHHYKIIDVRSCENKISQIVTFLTVKSLLEKSEVLFHFSIPPSFLSIHPFNKESSNKPILVNELVTMISLELKKTQKEIITLIDTYQTIHFKLLKMTSTHAPKAINSRIMEIITSLYDVRALSFPPSFALSCRELVSKYYREHMQEILQAIPTPSKLLMSVQLDRVEGDLNLTIAGKQYSFFLCSPFKFVYLHKREKALFYKIVNMYYEDINKKQSEKVYIDLVLQQIIHRINQQVYIKDFKIFLDGHFKGGINKIINNQEFTHLESRNIELADIFQHCDKYYLTNFPQGSIEEERARRTLDCFANKLRAVVREFFPLQRGIHYFQIRNKEEQKEAPFNIDASISRCNTELFMRMYFKTPGGELVDITDENLALLIIKHSSDIIKNNGGLLFNFYLKAKNNNLKSMQSIDTFTELIRQLCVEMSFEMERSLLYKRGTLAYHLDNFSFLWEKNEHTEVRLFLINKECEKTETLCKYIDDLVVQHDIPIKRVRPPQPEYMIYEENLDWGVVDVKQPFLMRVSKGKLDFFYHKSQRFFYEEELRFKLKIERQYIPNLNNFINACVLMAELVLTYELPLDPYELWMNESVNHSSNKFIAATNKKMPKRNPAISKFLAKKVTSANPSQQQSPSASVIKIKLSQLYRNYLPLNDRISPNVILQYIKGNQVFNLSIIHNMKNTYLFQKFYENNHLIFYFQEQQDQALIKQISEENKQLSFPKCKNYLIYTAFCLNSFLSQKVIDKKILPHLMEVLHKQLFDDVSRFLLVNHAVVQEFEENFIKRKEDEEKKEFRHEIPSLFHRDHIINYVIQHLEVYHYRVEFKSYQDKKTEVTESHKFIQSLRFVEPARYETVPKSEVNKIELTGTELLIDRRMSEPTNEHNSLSMLLAGNRIILDSSPLSNSSVRGSELMSISVENHSQHFYQTVEHTWLFNCEAPDKFLTEKYGKCLYFLKLKFKEDSSRALDQECSEIFKTNYLFTKVQNKVDFLQYVKPFLAKRNSSKKKQIQSKSYLVFEVGEYVGTPHFSKIEDSFAFITRACIAEVHLETCLYRCFSGLMRQYSFLKEEKKKALQSRDKEYFYKEKAWPSLLSCAREFDLVLTQVQSLLFFKYASNSNVIMRDQAYYFLHFLEEFSSIIIEFKKAYTSKEELSFELLIYGKTEQKELSFVLGNIRNLKKLRQDVQSLLSGSRYIKIGFIATDYISIIRHYVSYAQGKPTRSDPSLPTFNINDFKFFKDYESKDDFKFKRSSLVFYEITESDFVYCSYNFKAEIDEQIKDYLAAIDCWLIQKTKLFSLIKNIKERNLYEFTPMKTENSIKVKDPFYKLRKLHPNQGKEKPTVGLGFYRLMVNLIFKDLPEKLDKGQSEPARVKYAHHHSQTTELLQILKETVVEYKKYPSYKGNEKFSLEKYGREFVSILRQEYGLHT